MQNKIKVFENKQVRTLWNADEEEWYFSVVDVCNVLADSASKDPGAYWRKLKQRLKNEGSEVVTNCHGLKMQAADGKYYKTDCLDTKGVLRLVQSIPSPKAEPFKMWLAQVGSERLDEIADPEKAINGKTGCSTQAIDVGDWNEEKNGLYFIICFACALQLQYFHDRPGGIFPPGAGHQQFDFGRIGFKNLARFRRPRRFRREGAL